jgi:N-acetylglucosamine-6-phosphate deacetylase
MLHQRVDLQSSLILRCAKERLCEGAAMDGFHVEGPHISPDDGPRGAHPRRWVRAPDLDEFRRWQEATGNQIRIVTLAPDWPQSLRYIEAITAEGVVASIGHTGASGQQIADTVGAGATLSTHRQRSARRHAAPSQLPVGAIGGRPRNGGFHRGRYPSTAFFPEGRAARQDGRTIRAGNRRRRPASCPPGRYQLGEQAVELAADNRVMLVGQERLAGSALRMDRSVENLMRIAGLSLADAVSMATTNPARAGRVPGRTGGLVPNDRADLIQYCFGPKLTISIKTTFVSGVNVYEA